MSEMGNRLATIRRKASILDGVDRIQEVLVSFEDEDVDLVCFPETYLPGLRRIGLDLPEPDQAANERALERIRSACDRTGTAAIVGMKWMTDGSLYNRAWFVDADGEVLGYQTKNQITPDGRRQLFEVAGVPFGIAICHEGGRYPETVRWAADRGAKVVFQPQWTGRDDRGRGPPDAWAGLVLRTGDAGRAGENGG